MTECPSRHGKDGTPFNGMKKTLAALLVVSAVTLFLRILPWHTVFNGQYVSFLEGDSYNQMYYARLIADMPFWPAIHYTLSHNLLWSGTVAALSHIAPLEVVGAVLPPLMAVGTGILVYLIGSTLWDRTVGVLGALFVGIIPSEALHRSLLGFADHHAAEVLLVAFVLLCFTRTLKTGHETRKWMGVSALALFLYFENWTGGLTILVPLILAGLGIMAWGMIKRRPFYPGGLVILLPVVAALALYAPFGGWNRLAGIFPHEAGTVAALPVATQTTMEGISTFLAPVSQRTISELMPLFNPAGRGFDPGVVVANLHLFALAAPVGSVMLWQHRRNRGVQLFVVWALAVLLMALNNRRFLYYLTLPVGLFSAYLVWWLASKVKGSLAFNAGFLAVPFLLLSIPMATNLGLGSFYQMPREWHTMLTWMDKQAVHGQVTAWGDYGHWIKYETGFTPNLLPGPGGKDVAQLFLSNDVSQERALLAGLNTQYVVVDTETLSWKLPALAKIAGTTTSTSVQETLISRLMAVQNVPDFLRLDYESRNIRVYRVTPVSASSE